MLYFGTELSQSNESKNDRVLGYFAPCFPIRLPPECGVACPAPITMQMSLEQRAGAAAVGYVRSMFSRIEHGRQCPPTPGPSGTRPVRTWPSSSRAAARQHTILRCLTGWTFLTPPVRRAHDH